MLSAACDYKDTTRCNSDKEGPPPRAINLLIEGGGVTSGDDAPQVVGNLTSPTLQIFAKASDGSLIYDHTEYATWTAQAATAWYAPVVVGDDKDCSIAISNLGSDTTINQMIPFAQLIDTATGNVIDQAVLGVTLLPNQNAAFGCSAIFPKMANLPRGKGTNARLIIDGGITPMAMTVYQILGIAGPDGAMGGNVSSQAVFPYKK
jgi:hypothetical protein